MKRILCILITLLMVFSVTASAHSLEDIGMMRNYEAEMDLTITFDKPITIFNVLPEMEEVENYVDLNELVQSLIGTTVNAKVQGNISEDFSKIQACVLMTSTTPLKINKNAKLTGEFIMGVWVDADFADEENPKFDMIMQAPFLNKYLNVDLIEMLKEDEEAYGMFMTTLKQTLNKENFAATYSEVVDIIEKNAAISSGNNTLNINFDKDGANQYIYDTMEWSLKQSATYQDELYSVYYEEMAEEMLAAFENLEIFGDDGIKMQYTFDRAGNIKTVQSVSDIDINLYPLLLESGMDMTEISEEDCHIAFKMSESATYSNVGRATVDLPELTEENSVTMEELIGGGYEEAYPDYEEDYEEVPPYYIWLEDDGAIWKEDALYTGVRAFLDNVETYHYTEEEISHFEYDYTNGVLTIKNSGCSFLDFTEIIITIGETTVLVDGIEIVLEKPAAEINDRIFMSLDFYEKAFNYKCSYATYQFFENYFHIEFELNENFFIE